jgi:predicted acyltransferase
MSGVRGSSSDGKSRRRHAAPAVHPPSATAAVPSSGRLASIDALRGFDMFWIMGGDALFPALFGLAGLTGWSRQFEHSAWNGMTFYDLIFPLFLFIVGLSIPFSLEKRRASGESRGTQVRHILRRTIILVLLGFLVNGLLDFRFHEMRWPGVLQRIGLAYGAAALLALFTRTRTQAVAAVSLLLLYWGLMVLVPVPGAGAGVLTPDGNLAGYLDRRFLPGSFCCYGPGDNEGLLSTIPSVVSVLIGVFAGRWVRSTGPGIRSSAGLGVAGAALLAAGWCWAPFFPVNKLIWTGSYALVASGWSLLLFAIFHWTIDVRGCKGWSFPLRVIGLNAIAIYVVQALFDFGIPADTLVHGFIGRTGDLRPVIWSAVVIGLKWLFLFHLYRQKLFLKV